MLPYAIIQAHIVGFYVLVIRFVSYSQCEFHIHVIWIGSNSVNVIQLKG